MVDTIYIHNHKQEKNMRSLFDQLQTLMAHKTHAERMKIIWLWVKNDDIDLKRFKTLVKLTIEKRF